MTLLFVPPAES